MYVSAASESYEDNIIENIMGCSFIDDLIIKRTGSSAAYHMFLFLRII